VTKDNELRPKLFIGSIWMMSVNIVQKGIGLVSTLILARLLAPEDFGLVAMATVLIELLQAATEFGFDVSLIQKQNADRRHYDTAWTFNVLFGCTSGAILMAGAWQVAAFYDDARVAPVLFVLAQYFLLRGFENIGIVNFRKEFEYHREFLFFSLVKILAFFITISAAIILRNYWALVIGTICSRLISLALSYILHPYRPRFTLSARKDLFSFSVWMFVNNLLSFTRTRGAHFIVGRLLGPNSLGLYTVGTEIAFLPTTELIAPINRAIYPGYARIASDIFRLRAAYLNVLSIISTIAIPATLGIALVADLAIPVLLGPQWTGAIELVQWLALVGMLASLQSNTGVAYIALGKPHIQVSLQAFSAVILIPSAILLSLRFGIEGVAYAYVAANGASFTVSIFVATKVLGVRLRDLASAVIRPLASALVMLVAISELREHLTSASGQLPILLACVCTGAFVYVASIILIWTLIGRPNGAESFLLEKASRLPLVGTLALRLAPSSSD